MIALIPSAPMKLLLSLLAATVVAGSLLAQPSGKPPADFVLPDLSTVPGAVTFSADMFDLSESNFKYDAEKWMTLDLPEHTEASASIRLPIGGSYTVVVDAGLSLAGTSTFWVEVNDTMLEKKRVKVARTEADTKRKTMLMWPKTAIPAGATITIHGKAAAADGTTTSEARWSRLLLLPHNMGPSGPPMAPPPAPAAAE